jgi:hypothetical protein
VLGGSGRPLSVSFDGGQTPTPASRATSPPVNAETPGIDTAEKLHRTALVKSQVIAAAMSRHTSEFSLQSLRRLLRCAAGMQPTVLTPNICRVPGGGAATQEIRARSVATSKGARFEN